MKERLFFVLHWIAFICFFFLSIFVFDGTWALLLPLPFFMVLDYIINGKLHWLPWLRDK
tara:strand:+ start:434 stop:610 length:177 start_codon:yes stop_codon:yes gene_type:complete